MGKRFDNGADVLKILVAGGALQGVEVAYLAAKAGLETVLVDQRKNAPAAGLVPTFRQADVLDAEALSRIGADVDLVFPALESPEALAALHDWAVRRGVPMIHDPRAYAVSSSKIKSERFFRDAGVAVPATWPDCRFPVIAKPAFGSGSQGIRFFTDSRCLTDALGDDPAAAGWIVQEFLPGPTYSVEVIRMAGRATAVQVTDLHMDEGYDCKRVTAPSALSSESQAELCDLSVTMADALDLNGIMDVEAVLHGGGFKVLEIDARFPSQTPMAVYWSCGINMVEMLVGAATGDAPGLRRPAAYLRGAVLEHVQVGPGVLRVTGEHAMTRADSLSVHADFFGADEAVTDFEDGKHSWVATLIFTGSDMDDAWGRRHASLSAIRRKFGIERFLDPSPDDGVVSP